MAQRLTSHPSQGREGWGHPAWAQSAMFETDRAPREVKDLFVSLHKR